MITKRSKILILLISICILLLVNISGAISMVKYGKYQNWTVVNFFLITFLIIFNHNREKRKLIAYVVILSLFTFIAEVIGTSTGLLFGDYYYTQKLGIELFEVPLFIGLFYFTLVYSVSVIVVQVLKAFKIYYFTKIKYLDYFLYSILISALITLIDYLWIEKVAMKFEWWVWIENNAIIPSSNYYSWFGVCLISVFIFRFFQFSSKNYLAWAVITSLISFFIIVLKM